MNRILRSRPLLTVLALAALAAPAIPSSAGAQQQATGVRESDDTFDWAGAIPAGSWLRIQNISGAITCTRRAAIRPPSTPRNRGAAEIRATCDSRS